MALVSVRATAAVVLLLIHDLLLLPLCVGILSLVHILKYST